MISILDSKGNEIAKVSEDMFPLQIPAITITGKKDYKVYLNYVRKQDGTKDKTKIKNINVGIERQD